MCIKAFSSTVVYMTHSFIRGTKIFRRIQSSSFAGEEKTRQLSVIEVASSCSDVPKNVSGASLIQFHKELSSCSVERNICNICAIKTFNEF